MSWHIGDYKKDTGHLRAAEHGAYFLLCMHYWATGGLPDDDKQLATIACMTIREWKAARPVIEPLFKGDGKWKHKRIEEELITAHAKYEKRASAGKRGGNAAAKAKQTPSNATSNAVAKPQQPITDNPKEEDAALRAREPVPKIVSSESLLAHWPAWLKIRAALGVDPDDHRWVGRHGRVAQWLANGWDVDLDIIPTILNRVAARAAKNKTPAHSLEFFEDAIADAYAGRLSPVPVATLAQPGVSHAKPAAYSPITAAIDRHIERFERQSREECGGGEIREAPPRLLSNG